MSDFHGGFPPLGPGPMVPPFGGDMRMPLDVESKFMYNGTSGGTRATKYRMEDTLLTAKEWSGHPIAKYKINKKLSRIKNNIRLVTKYMRRYQINEIILKDMDAKAAQLANTVRVNSNKSVDSIIRQLDSKNARIELQPRFKIFNPLFKLRDKWDNFSEKLYILRYKVKASLRYNNKDKRKYALMSVSNEIKHREELLDGYLYHNFNICSVYLGYISSANGFDGLMPDTNDINTLNQIKNNRKNSLKSRYEASGNAVNTAEDVNVRVNDNTSQYAYSGQNMDFGVDDNEFDDIMFADNDVDEDENNKVYVRK